jgi:hypothetical protein
MVSAYARQYKDEMSIVPFQDQKWEYRGSDKAMHISLSGSLGTRQSWELNCHLLMKECYYQLWVSLSFFISYFVISHPSLFVS